MLSNNTETNMFQKPEDYQKSKKKSITKHI
jgi:hypothetical protein